MGSHEAYPVFIQIRADLDVFVLARPGSFRFVGHSPGLATALAGLSLEGLGITTVQGAMDEVTDFPLSICL